MRTNQHGDYQDYLEQKLQNGYYLEYHKPESYITITITFAMSDMLPYSLEITDSSDITGNHFVDCFFSLESLTSNIPVSLSLFNVCTRKGNN